MHQTEQCFPRRQRPSQILSYFHVSYSSAQYTVLQQLNWATSRLVKNTITQVLQWRLAPTLLSHSHVSYASRQCTVLPQRNWATWTVYNPAQSLYARRPSTLSLLFTTPHLPGLPRSTVFPGILTPIAYRNEHAERTASAGTSQGGAVSIHHIPHSGETRPAALTVMPAWLPYVPQHTSYTCYLVRGISNPSLSRFTHNSLHEESQFPFYDDFRKHQTSLVEPKCPRLSSEQAYYPRLLIYVLSLYESF